MRIGRYATASILTLCLGLLVSCAKEKPGPPARLNLLDPDTEISEPDPFLLTVTLEGDAVVIQWQRPPMSEIAGWVVLRSESSDFALPDTLATLDLPAISYLDTQAEPGRIYFYKILASDRAGGISAGSHLVSAAVETQPILRIEGELEYATSRRVTLSILTAKADSMRISNDSGFSGALWQPFQSEVSDWLLAAGEGVKVVYAQIRFPDGHLSPTVLDSILPELITNRSLLSTDGTEYVRALVDTVVIHANGADSLKIWNSGDPVPDVWSVFAAKTGEVRRVWMFPGGEGWKDLVVAFKNDFLIEAGPETVGVAVDLSPPIADLVVSPPDSGRVFSLDASGSYDPLDVTPIEDLLFSWQWESGAGWTPPSTERILTHEYTVFGPKTIRLVVTDGAGRADTLSYSVEAANRAPTAPTGPFPANGGMNQSLLPALAWTPSVDRDFDPVTYTIYFGNTPDPTQAIVGAWADTTFPAPPLETGQTYYWTVVPIDVHGLEGEVSAWSFTTHTPTGHDYALAASWGSQGSGDGEFEVVRDVARDGSDRVYVADVNNQRIQILSIFGQFQGEITEVDFLPIFNPGGLAVDSDRSVYIVDGNNHRVLKFDSSGEPVWSLGGRGEGDGRFQYPRDVCVDGDGFVYVLDTGNHRVQKFHANGVYADQWGGLGDGNGEFATPSGLTESQGFVFVADSFNHRVQKFTTEGEFVLSWDSDWDPGVPRAVATDAAGSVFVLDSARGLVQTFTADGARLSTWGEGDLGNPEGIWVDPGGDLIWVADTYNHRIQVFERQ